MNRIRVSTGEGVVISLLLLVASFSFGQWMHRFSAGMWFACTSIALLFLIVED